MNFKTLSDGQLVEELKQTVNKEREITVRVLWLLREVERRMLYAARGYSSLFQYCVSELKYSESAAQRRIASMRLLRDLSQESRKEVESKISNGDLNLSHLSQVQSHLRNQANALKAQEAGKKASESIPASAPTPVPVLKTAQVIAQEKLDLLDKITGTSSRQCEQILASLLPEPPLEKEKSRPISATHSRVTLIVPNELMKKIERIQNARAHQLKENTILEVLSLLVEEEIKRDEKKKRIIEKPISHVAASREHSTPVGQNETTANPKQASGENSFQPTLIKTQTRYIKRNDYRALYQEADHRCQFEDPETKRRCDSRFKLHVEHCQPFALGGSNELDNLKLLCAQHNAWRAKKVFGRDVKSFQILGSKV